MIHPMIIKQKGTKLCVQGKRLEELEKKLKSILWVNDGLYAMIPIERIKNTLNVLADRKKLDNNTPNCLEFTWVEAVPIPAESGQSMEKYNGGEK